MATSETIERVNSKNSRGKRLVGVGGDGSGGCGVREAAAWAAIECGARGAVPAGGR